MIVNSFLRTFGIDEDRAPGICSGAASSVISPLGTLFVLLRRLNCHASGCWRIGIHHVVGTPFVTCRKHHPVVPTGRIGADQIAQVHQGAVDSGLAVPDSHYLTDASG